MWLRVLPGGASLTLSYPLCFEIWWGWKIGVYYQCEDCERKSVTLGATAQPIFKRGPIVPPFGVVCDTCRLPIDKAAVKR